MRWMIVLYSAMRCIMTIYRLALHEKPTAQGAEKKDKHRVFLRQAPNPPKQNSSQQLDAKMPQHKRVSEAT